MFNWKLGYLMHHLTLATSYRATCGSIWRDFNRVLLSGKLTPTQHYYTYSFSLNEIFVWTF